MIVGAMLGMEVLRGRTHAQVNSTAREIIFREIPIEMNKRNEGDSETGNLS